MVNGTGASFVLARQGRENSGVGQKRRSTPSYESALWGWLTEAYAFFSGKKKKKILKIELYALKAQQLSDCKSQNYTKLLMKDRLDSLAFIKAVRVTSTQSFILIAYILRLV